MMVFSETIQLPTGQKITRSVSGNPKDFVDFMSRLHASKEAKRATIEDMREAVARMGAGLRQLQAGES